MAEALNQGDTRTPLSRLVASMTVSEGRSRAQIPADWLQGRAVYGGLSAARDSKLAHVELTPPPTTPFADCGYFFEDRQGRNQGPNFAQHFNSRFAAGALPVSAAAAADFTV